MATRLFLIAAIALLSGCGVFSQPDIVIKREPIEVEVPVYLPAPVPGELRQPFVITRQQMPVFISPTHADASSCLSPTGEQQLRGMLVGLMGRVREWEAYGPRVE